MKNILKILVVVLALQTSYGQESFQFQVKFQPKSSYKSNLEMKLDMKMQVDSETEKSLGKNNVETNMLMSFETLTKTQEISKDGKLPFEISYTDLDTKMSVIGQEIPNITESVKSEILGLKLKGIETDKGREYSYQGESEKMKETYVNMMNTMSLLTFYPKEVFKVGDSKEVLVPFKMPLQQGMKMEMNIKATYTLTKLDSEKAYFDVKMSSEGDINPSDQLKIHIDQYQLSGKLTINRKDQNINDSEFSGPMNMTMDMDTVKIKMMSENNYKTKSIKL
mgnify:FL=1